MKDWIRSHFEIKFRLAGHIARRDDGRWSTKVLYWKPTHGSRAQGHPHRRWTDDIDRFFKCAHDYTPGQWMELAMSRKIWASLSKPFSDFCLNNAR